MVSIIIPTLNEENYLPFLLDSIKNQNFKDWEIIVADAGSKDTTIEIAKNYGCKVIKGGLPAKGRNEGAKIAKGDLFLFLDADTILPANFFEKILKESKERNLDVASFCLEPQTKNWFEKFLFEAFYNLPILISEKFLAHGAQAILVKREIFEKVSGFDEKIKFSEDHSFVRKAKKNSNFGILKSVRVFSSLRRFKKEGWIKTYLKYLLAEIYMICFGDIKKDIFRYKFGNF
jgi:glycosyltransferase involved in cell wall biosynthesis